MKSSANRHLLTKLRQVTGLVRKELAAILDWPFTTYQKIEFGKFRMTRAHALRVQGETGVKADNVLSEDVAAPVSNCWGNPYTRATYKRVRAEAIRPKVGTSDRWNLGCATAILATRVAAIMLQACKKNKAGICFLELSEHLEMFEKKFPQDRKLHANLSESPLVQLGKLADSMHELSFRFEQEANQHCLRELHKLTAALSPAEKARTQATLKWLLHKES
jgi:transcriptional regulator with XRE-family HTH domain